MLIKWANKLVVLFFNNYWLIGIIQKKNERKHKGSVRLMPALHIFVLVDSSDTAEVPIYSIFLCEHILPNWIQYLANALSARLIVGQLSLYHREKCWYDNWSDVFFFLNVLCLRIYGSKLKHIDVQDVGSMNVRSRWRVARRVGKPWMRA